MEIGNEMQYHKIGTDSELLYEDGGIRSTLISIKIIGSNTLSFPLPPSEVLLKTLGQFQNLGFVIMSTRENIRLIARTPYLSYALYCNLFYYQTK